MLKKSITFEDFDGNEVTEDFYFHLSKADLIEMELSQRGGMKEFLKKIIASKDGATIVAEFKKIILNSYGQRSDDGRRFIKTESLRDEFQQTEAFSVLFLELCTNAEAASAFVNGIVPKGLEADMAAVQAGREPNRAERRHPSDSAADRQSPIGREADVAVGSDREPTEAARERAHPILLMPDEIREMDADELKSGLATGKYKLQ